MKVVMILGETRFYHPDFLARLVERMSDEVSAVGIVRKVPRRYSLDHYLLRHFYFLRPSEIMKLGTREVQYSLKDRLGKTGKDGHFYSVLSTCQFFGLNHFRIDLDINQPNYLEQIQSYEPDVVLSSNPLIFGKELLGIPRICCLNRHSGLLPAYGGLWPVFQAVRNRDDAVGVSVHTMERKIDRGVVLSQIQIPITATDTVTTLYDKCFDRSVDAVLDALGKVARGDFTPVDPGRKRSYFSFPDRTQWQEFRAAGGRFI
jgi:methionyl-tRNA formyltransferase